MVTSSKLPRRVNVVQQVRDNDPFIVPHAVQFDRGKTYYMFGDGRRMDEAEFLGELEKYKAAGLNPAFVRITDGIPHLNGNIMLVSFMDEYDYDLSDDAHNADLTSNIRPVIRSKTYNSENLLISVIKELGSSATLRNIGKTRARAVGPNIERVLHEMEQRGEIYTRRIPTAGRPKIVYFVGEEPD